MLASSLLSITQNRSQCCQMRLATLLELSPLTSIWTTFLIGRASVRDCSCFQSHPGSSIRGSGVANDFERPHSLLQRYAWSFVVGVAKRAGQRTEGRGPEVADEYAQVLASISRHAAIDIKDFPTSSTASSCSYTPFGEGGVINAAAYRASLLASASQVFESENYWRIAERNLNFVLENQNADGSWFYAVDGVRDFVDHYHTCFVMKALAKIHTLTGHPGTFEALSKGVAYYLENLFAADRLPKPFSKAPRLTVYKRELYDCAECINLCLLLRDRFPQLEAKLQTVIEGVLRDWIKPDGSFRSRRLHFGWDNVPMHRWGQAQMFRSLAFYVRETAETDKWKSDPLTCATLSAEPLEA